MVVAVVVVVLLCDNDDDNDIDDANDTGGIGVSSPQDRTMILPKKGNTTPSCWSRSGIRIALRCRGGIRWRRIREC